MSKKLRPASSPLPILGALAVGVWAGACSQTPQFGSVTGPGTTGSGTQASSSGIALGGGPTTTGTGGSAGGSGGTGAGSTTTVAGSSGAVSTSAASTTASVAASTAASSSSSTTTTTTAASSSSGCVPKSCGDLGAECGQASDGCGGMAQCGNCTGLDACGVAGTPNHCDPAVVVQCGEGCPFGIPIATINNNVCDPTNADCFTQNPGDILCSRAASVALPCGTPCNSDQHSGGLVPDCQCMTSGGMATICIANP